MGQIVEDTVVSQRGKLRVDGSLALLPATLFLHAIVLSLLLYIALVIAPLIPLHLRGCQNVMNSLTMILPATLITIIFQNSSYFAQEDEFVEHPQNEISPENVQCLQHQQEAIEEVISREWLEEIQ